MNSHSSHGTMIGKGEQLPLTALLNDMNILEDERKQSEAILKRLELELRQGKNELLVLQRRHSDAENKKIELQRNKASYSSIYSAKQLELRVIISLRDEIASQVSQSEKALEKAERGIDGKRSLRRSELKKLYNDILNQRTSAEQNISKDEMLDGSEIQKRLAPLKKQQAAILKQGEYACAQVRSTQRQIAELEQENASLACQLWEEQQQLQDVEKERQTLELTLKSKEEEKQSLEVKCSSDLALHAIKGELNNASLSRKELEAEGVALKQLIASTWNYTDPVVDFDRDFYMNAPNSHNNKSGPVPSGGSSSWASAAGRLKRATPKKPNKKNPKRR